MTMPKLYENREFIIFGDESKRNRPAYILYNKNKEFANGHTHLNNYHTAKWLMELYSNRKLPMDLKSEYLLTSLIRISNDEKYTTKVESLLSVRKNKAHNHYYNVQKGVKKRKP